MSRILIKNAQIVNENAIQKGDVLIEGKYIISIGNDINEQADTVIDAAGKFLLPGAIDDQVHFREPGLTHKAEIYTEARAAVAGGVTSYMEQPNTVPAATTIELLEQKYKCASEVSLANYSFFLGTTNHNFDEIMKINPRTMAGLKIFLGSSTGDMLVDDENQLNRIFEHVKVPIAVHAEDDKMIKVNLEDAKAKFGDDLNANHHHLIRSREACYASSSKAIARAKKYGTRLHIFHLSTAEELELLDNSVPLKEKKITAEVCIHHLWFSEEDYATKGNLIKWNPAVKKSSDKDALLKALLDDRIDVIATDHAPHTLEEKQQPYLNAPSGGPLVQHSLVVMLEMVHQKKISLETVVRKMSHAVADCFRIEKRGYIREGYFADLVLVDMHQPWTVAKDNLLYKCGWSPLEGATFQSKISHTFVNGHLVYCNGVFDESKKGERIMFDR
jgi:dihydroorotase